MPETYSSKYDFGPYSEPSWVPVGLCKCCAMIPASTDTREMKKPISDLTKLIPFGETEKKKLAVMYCPNCDNRKSKES